MEIRFVSGPHEGRSVSVDANSEFIFGRHGNVPLVDSRASRRHARLFWQNGEWVVEDLNSSNGTYVNQRRIAKPASLAEGDKISIGRSTIVVEQLNAPIGRDAAAPPKPRNFLTLEASPLDEGEESAVAVAENPINRQPKFAAPDSPAIAVESRDGSEDEAGDQEFGSLPGSTPWTEEHFEQPWSDERSVAVAEAEPEESPDSLEGERAFYEPESPTDSMLADDQQTLEPADVMPAAPQGDDAAAEAIAQRDEPRIAVDETSADEPRAEAAPTGAFSADETSEDVNRPAVVVSPEERVEPARDELIAPVSPAAPVAMTPKPAGADEPMLDLHADDAAAPSPAGQEAVEASLAIEPPVTYAPEDRTRADDVHLDLESFAEASVSPQPPAVEDDESQRVANRDVEHEVDHLPAEERALDIDETPDVAEEEPAVAAVDERSVEPLPAPALEAQHAEPVQHAEDYEPSEHGAIGHAVHDKDTEHVHHAEHVEADVVLPHAASHVVEGSIAAPIFSEWDLHEAEINHRESPSSASDHPHAPVVIPPMAGGAAAAPVQPAPSVRDVFSVPLDRLNPTAPETPGGDPATKLHPAESPTAPIPPVHRSTEARPEGTFASSGGIELKRNGPAPEPSVALVTRDADPLAQFTWPPQYPITIKRRVWPYVLLVLILLAVLASLTLQFLNQRQTRDEIATLTNVLKQNEQETAELLIDEIRREIREAPRTNNAEELAALNEAVAQQTQATERAARDLATRLEQSRSTQSTQDEQRLRRASEDMSKVLAELDALKRSIGDLSAHAATVAAAEEARRNESSVKTPPPTVAANRSPDRPATNGQGSTDAAADLAAPAADRTIPAPSEVARAMALPASASIVYFVDASDGLKNSIPEAMAEVKRLIRQSRSKEPPVILMLYNDRLVQIAEASINQAGAPPQGEDIVDLGKMDLRSALERAAEFEPRTLHLLSDTLGNGSVARDSLAALGFAGVRVDVMQFYTRNAQDTLKAIARSHNGYYTFVPAAP